MILILAACSFFAVYSLINHLESEREEELRSMEKLSINDRAMHYESPYNWEGLDRSDGRFAYYENGALESLLGVDVSSYQKDISWNEVAADGIEFAFVRLGNRGYTEGGLFEDEYATANLDGAKTAGLKVGAYFFSQAITAEEAREEANFALQVLGGRPLDLPIVFDHEPVPYPEGRANSVDRDTLTACAQAFCETIEAAGYRSMVYGNARDMSRYYLYKLNDLPLWHAEYNTPTPLVFYDISLWQYTDSGQVAGISGGADLNILFLTAPQKILG